MLESQLRHLVGGKRHTQIQNCADITATAVAALGGQNTVPRVVYNLGATLLEVDTVQAGPHQLASIIISTVEQSHTGREKDLPAPSQNTPVVANLLGQVNAAVGTVALVVTAVARQRGARQVGVVAAVCVVDAATESSKSQSGRDGVCCPAHC